MKDRFDDFWKDFFIKDYMHWKTVYEETKNPEAERRKNEDKDILYRRWFIVMSDEPKSQNKQYLLF